MAPWDRLGGSTPDMAAAEDGLSPAARTSATNGLRRIHGALTRPGTPAAAARQAAPAARTHACALAAASLHGMMMMISIAGAASLAATAALGAPERGACLGGCQLHSHPVSMLA